MGYRYGNSDLDYLYNEMKDALVENGIDVFMQMVSDAMTGVFARMVNEKLQTSLQDMMATNKK